MSTLFAPIENITEKNSNPWENVACIGLDNCITNMGRLNSIKSHFLQRNQTFFTTGFNCHVADITATAAGKTFRSIKSFVVEDR